MTAALPLSTKESCALQDVVDGLVNDRPAADF